uniref:Uncharacterized protein n=1 Tax=Chromera velia CCMP2878 TaxID=1169474 RepID=A0A0G4I4N3_9ALVE|eukprot:Cvel_10924.t1-p1 / transcript=Cvel_10924.t1 / gene=Cvel_10924 / organism=Chromera_velia_CCMP2878 / gene_product=hypothetical protein / transcript_product=hypothetical protein / location=Cvel_scaffold671:46703-46936(-) / protein_length=78 / sequence_SO=supercontig / SO=protein_coding / is_pseudo=false
MGERERASFDSDFELVFSEGGDSEQEKGSDSSESPSLPASPKAAAAAGGRGWFRIGFWGGVRASKKAKMTEEGENETE